MSLKDILFNNAEKLAKAAIKIGREKPMYVLGFGLAVMTVGDILMVKATMESSQIIDEVAEEKKAIEKVEAPAPVKAKMITKSYMKFGGKIIEKAALPFLCKTAGVMCVVGAAEALQFNALTATATVGMLEAQLDKVYKKIEEEYGKEAVDKIMYGKKEMEIEETITKEDGSTEVVKKKVVCKDPKACTPLLERYYDASNPTFDRGLNGYIVNIDRLRNAVIWAQKKLDSGIPVNWNELFGSFGFMRIRPGYNWGWNPGDRIDLGVNLYPQTQDEAIIFGDCVLLKPNCVKLFDIDDSEECFKTTIYGGQAVDAL